MADQDQPYVTIRARRPGDGSSVSSADSTHGESGEYTAPSATHDTSRVSYHVKHIDTFAKSLEDSATRAFPNRGRSLQRYKKVQALLLHWKSDDLFVLPELEDLERCLREDYSFETDIFPIPSENSHLELMMKVGSLIKEHESTETLFVVYYGGHARIDESRQSTWCATRHSASPWLQWSAIQTLLERSLSDTLILLDCCAGAASATFPNGKSITETISASSWDAIAPDPGRYSFTNALIEVLGEWRLRTFSAAMLHAEVLARLKHPRPITINGKHFEARSTPVHFMMTSNHKAPSIELGRIVPADRMPPSPPQEAQEPELGPPVGRGPYNGPVPEPNEDEPHVMISLALEDNQRLDLNAWEQWLSSFPALAKYVKVQGVFKSHSTLLLLSMPVMIWDLLPEDHACSFVAFIRSNNLIRETRPPQPAVADSTTQTVTESEEPGEDDDNDFSSVFSGTTMTPTERRVSSILSNRVSPTAADQPPSHRGPQYAAGNAPPRTEFRRTRTDPLAQAYDHALVSPTSQRSLLPTPGQALSQRQLTSHGSRTTLSYHPDARQDENITRVAILNQQRSSRRTIFTREEDIPDGPALAQHIVDRLEEYYQQEPSPSVAVTEFFASNLGIETRDIDAWFHRRRQVQRMTDNLQNLPIVDQAHQSRVGAKMVLPGHLNSLLEIFPTNQVLLVDLRSPTDFEKSHVYGAVNLRVPVSFVEHNFDLLERAFTDDHSRRNFAKWSSARCVVVYDRAVEFPWECPTADALLDQFHRRGWKGHVYVLKGHYREFSKSFDKYITGDRMTQAAKDNIDSLRERPPLSQDEQRRSQEKYDSWLRVLENEERSAPADLIPSKKAERLRDVKQHQVELEAALEAQNPSLYRKAQDLRPAPPSVAGEKPHGKGSYDKTEPRPGLVAPLARGLEKMQHEAGYADVSSPAAKSPGHGYHSSSKRRPSAPTYDKLGDLAGEEFDEIDPSRDEQLRDDPAFQKAGEAASGADMKPASSAAGPKERPFWKRLRSGK